MSRKLLAHWFLWGSLLAAPLSLADEPVKQPAESDEVNVRPVMRVEDRGEEYFSSLDCSRLQSVAVHSETEQRHLERRKQECLDKYRAFLPTPVSR